MGESAGEPLPDHHVHVILKRKTRTMSPQRYLCTSLTILLVPSLHAHSRSCMMIVYWHYSFPKEMHILPFLLLWKYWSQLQIRLQRAALIKVNHFDVALITTQNM